MSGGYALRPEAFSDLDDIRGYIAQQNPDAADRVITEIFDTIRRLVPFPNQGHRRPDLTSRPFALHSGAPIPDCLRTKRKTPVGCSVMHARSSPRIMAAILRGRE
jgi:plasmid stabilization system protein ParE